MIEMYLLEQLDAFARLGTLSAAADELHVTQPALSRSMRKLEALLGVSLFERGKSRITLNETGRVAAECAHEVLRANRGMIERVIAFDRSLHSLAVGTCTPHPLGVVLPAIQQRLPGQTVTSEVVASSQRLMDGLLEHRYQLVVAPHASGDSRIISRPFLDETLCISVPEGHPLSGRRVVSFSDLATATILVNGSVGFWLDLCRRELPHAGLLVQEGIDQLGQVVEASSLPVFSSDRVVERYGEVPNRSSIPIQDDAAHVTYHIACLTENSYRYAALVEAIAAAWRAQP